MAQGTKPQGREGGAALAPRVLRVLSLIQRLEPQEQSQLGQLLPPAVTSLVRVSDVALAEAVAYFQEKVRQRPRPPALDDPFIAGLTYQEYFALPDSVQQRPSGIPWQPRHRR